MWFMIFGSDTGLPPPNRMTLSSEILVKEKNAHGGGGLPVTVGLDQHPADKQASLLSLALLTLHVLLMYDRHSVPYHTRATVHIIYE